MANALQDAYASNYQQMQSQGAYNPLSMQEQTLEGITQQLADVYRPQLEQQILNRYGATKKQKAAIDVDAASRGMGTSTWVTDAKNRLMNAEASDIASMERDYASQLAGDALQQYNNYLQDRQNLDRYNQSLAIQLGDTAYGRASDQYNAGLIDGTLPQLANQLSYEQNAWNFGRAKELAPFEDKMNQLSYDQALWNFQQAQKAAQGNGVRTVTNNVYWDAYGNPHSSEQEAREASTPASISAVTGSVPTQQKARQRIISVE